MQHKLWPGLSAFSPAGPSWVRTGLGKSPILQKVRVFFLAYPATRDLPLPRPPRGRKCRSSRDLLLGLVGTQGQPCLGLPRL